MVMSAVDLATRSATELAGLIRTRDVSAVEVVEATLARIDALNPSLNAFISVDRDRARREAARPTPTYAVARHAVRSSACR